MNINYVRVTLRIPIEVHKKTIAAAAKNNRSLNGQIVNQLMLGVGCESGMTTITHNSRG